MKKTKLLMTITAAILGLIGVILTFFPQEVSNTLQMDKANSIIFKILGSLYFAFAMLNWMTKANLIGGIYSRPIAMANFIHFMIGVLVLAKSEIKNSNISFFWPAMMTYLILAVLFGIVLFTSPNSKVQPILK